MANEGELYVKWSKLHGFLIIVLISSSKITGNCLAKAILRGGVRLWLQSGMRSTEGVKIEI